MRRVVVVAALLATAGSARAQVVPELGAFGAFGQRWRDGGRSFTGATLALGLSSPASQPGPGVGLRAAVTGFPTRDRNPNVACVADLVCNNPEESYVLSVLQATAVLIPYRTRDVEFEFGFGVSKTKLIGSLSDRTGFLTAGALSGRVRDLTRVQIGYERHIAPSEGDEGSRTRGLFQHVVRIGLVYGGTRRP